MCTTQPRARTPRHPACHGSRRRCWCSGSAVRRSPALQHLNPAPHSHLSQARSRRSRGPRGPPARAGCPTQGHTRSGGERRPRPAATSRAKISQFGRSCQRCACISMCEGAGEIAGQSACMRRQRRQDIAPRATRCRQSDAAGIAHLQRAIAVRVAEHAHISRGRWRIVSTSHAHHLEWERTRKVRAIPLRDAIPELVWRQREARLVSEACAPRPRGRQGLRPIGHWWRRVGEHRAGFLAHAGECSACGARGSEQRRRRRRGVTGIGDANKAPCAAGAARRRAAGVALATRAGQKRRPRRRCRRSRHRHRLQRGPRAVTAPPSRAGAATPRACAHRTAGDAEPPSAPPRGSAAARCCSATLPARARTTCGEHVRMQCHL